MTWPSSGELSDGAMGQYRDAFEALQVNDIVGTKADLSVVQKHYLRRLPLKDFMARLQTMDFAGSPKLKAMMSRLGAGISHLTPISIAGMRMPDMPV
jgi:hypothetical protein